MLFPALKKNRLFVFVDLIPLIQPISNLWKYIRLFKNKKILLSITKPFYPLLELSENIIIKGLQNSLSHVNAFVPYL